MRWPWELLPWGRGRGADAADSAARDAESPPSGAASPPSAAFQPAPAGGPAAWTHLPPLQRSVSDTTAVAPPAAFRSSLTTHQNPSFLAPLGHLVDPDGPGGLVGGLASSVGGPIPYEGVDELRVPDRPAPKPAPAVQRRIATLRPEPSVVPDASAVMPDAPVVGPTVDESLPGHSDPAAVDTAPPSALVVARPAAPPEPGPVRRSDPVSSGTEATQAPQAATLGSSGSAVDAVSATPAPDTAVPTSAPVPATTQLTVPVQRSAAASTSGGSSVPTRQPGDVAPAATLRPVSPTLSTEAAPTAAQSMTAAPPPPSTVLDATSATVPEAALSAPNPTSAPDLVVARSAVEPANQQLDPPTVDEHAPTGPDSDPAAVEPHTEAALTGLLSSHPPLVESSPLDLPAQPPSVGTPAGDLVPLTVPGSTNLPKGSGPTLQRRFADPTPSAPTTRAASLSGTGPDVATVATGSAPRVLDDLGYPPLIARSVQRRAADAEAGRPGASGWTPPSADLALSATSPQAPLSGFTAAISALQDPPSGPVVGGGVAEPPVHPAASDHGSALVVARRLPPDQTGRLPVPEARLQGVGHPTGHLTSVPGMVQRSLVAGRSPVATPTSTAGSAPTTTTPAVQRLRYEDLTSPSEHRFGDQPVGTDEPEVGLSESGVVATAMPATSAGTAGWSSAAGASSWGSPSSGAPLSGLQRTSAGTVQRNAAGPGHPTVETPTYPRIGEPPASLVSALPGSALPGSALPGPALPGPDLPGSALPPMVQRRFDAPAPSTPVTPPASPDPPPMAVSGRSVGLAEMFALAAAQSSADDATVQRSAETEVQLTSLDSAPSESPASTSSAAPPAPATAARPPSGAELEEMARRLYEPLSARLRAELWQDRERSGLLTDLRP